MQSGLNEWEPINSYALVAYLQGPLAEFLDSLRAELVCGCDVRAHVTILPPRPLHGELEDAKRQIASALADYPTFSIRATRIDVFEQTSVIYADVGLGKVELNELHDILNKGPLYQLEPFPYHPHLTLAQNITQEDAARLRVLAEKRWGEFSGSREFTIDRLTFVQNTIGNRWLDLAEFELSREALEPVG